MTDETQDNETPLEPEPEPEPEPEREPAEGEPEPEPAEPEPEPEPETPVAQGATPEEWEKRWKRADNAFEAYKRKIEGIFGEEAENLMPVVTSPSAPPGFVYGPDAGRVPDEIKQPLLEFYGFAREQQYEPDPETEECPVCLGKGKVATRGHVAGKETHGCRRCQGKGFLDHGKPLAQGTSNGATEEGFSLAPVGTPDAPERDMWGEPLILPDGRENPNYGKAPQYKVTVEPWGMTAGLGAQDVQVSG